MDLEVYVDLLRQVEVEDAGESYKRARRVEPLQARSTTGIVPAGSSHPLRCETDVGIYVIKYQHPLLVDRPLKGLTTDLICGRLGQLFSRPICPDVAVIQLSDEVIEEGSLPPGWVCPIAGPCFGSVLVKDGERFFAKGHISSHAVRAEDAARIVVFWTWLRPTDREVILRPFPLPPLSIDHEKYLTGDSWNWSWIDEVYSVSNAAPNPFPADLLATMEAFEQPLAELLALAPEQIVRACSNIPTEWEKDGTAPPDYRARIARFIDLRRSQVRQGIEGYLSHLDYWLKRSSNG